MGRKKDTRTPARRMMDQLQTELQFMQALISTAERCGWTVHHETDSRKSRPGFPDLVCVHPAHGHCFIELKAEGGYLQPDQRAWRDALVEAGARYYVFRPRYREVADDLFTTGRWPNQEEFLT